MNVRVPSVDLFAFFPWALFSFYNSPSFLRVKVNEEREEKNSQYYFGQNNFMCYQPYT